MVSITMMLRANKWMLNRALPAWFVCSANGAYAAGLPQLDHHWYANQLFWLVVSFGALYALVSIFIAPSIGTVLNTRAAAIDEAIREAERAKHTAESTKGSIESAHVDARNKASAFLAKAQAETTANATAAFAKLDHDLARKLTSAEVRIEESKTKALSAVTAATANLAGAMAAKLLGHAVADADVQAAVASAAKTSGK